jgi:hypothetical protein
MWVSGREAIGRIGVSEHVRSSGLGGLLYRGDEVVTLVAGVGREEVEARPGARVRGDQEAAALWRPREISLAAA